MEDHGVRLSLLPAAVLIHEGIGVVILASVWAGCYFLQPSVRVSGPFERQWPGAAAGLRERWGPAMHRAQDRMKRWPILSRATDPSRLVVSLAESAIARNAIRPLTIPLKLCMTYAIVRTL
eukprot:TRINITY_DN3473_c0_g1_i1.p1 TRINITY_DN3473_c0_g1~~TRINITY_DN3473_c0_g1_i1.p1  ORF type:complete len:121 (-),score=4.11 TRINITY_DN3473_c0_g1_i1:145-507(-)